MTMAWTISGVSIPVPSGASSGAMSSAPSPSKSVAVNSRAWPLLIQNRAGSGCRAPKPGIRPLPWPCSP